MPFIEDTTGVCRCPHAGPGDTMTDDEMEDLRRIVEQFGRGGGRRRQRHGRCVAQARR